MPLPLRVLLVEDNPSDAELVIRELRRANFAPDWHRVDTEKDYLSSLSDNFDIILSDYVMPQFSGLRAAELLRESGLSIPFILISGTIGEETAVEAMKHGATDYLLKDRIARLGAAVERALEQKRLRDEQKRTEEELRVTHEKLRQLLAHSPAVIYTLQISGQSLTPTVVSDNMERLLGITVAESASYEWWLKNLHPEDRDRVLTAVTQALTQHGYSLEYRIRHKDGTYRWIEDNNRVIRDASGQAKEAVGVWTDITERKQAEEAIKQRAAELERFHRLSVGRELQMIELKKEVNELAKLAGRTTPYDLSFLEKEDVKTGPDHD